MADAGDAAGTARAGYGESPKESRRFTGLPSEPDEQMHEAAELRHKAAEALAKLLSVDGVISGRLDAVSYGCFIRASELATHFAHDKVEAAHILAGFSLDNNGRTVLEAFHFKPDGILKECFPTLAGKPRWLGDAIERPEPLYGEEIQAWVKAASDYAIAKRRPENRTIEAEDFFRVLTAPVKDPRLKSILNLVRAEPDPPLSAQVTSGFEKTFKRLEKVRRRANAAAIQIVRHRRASKLRAQNIKSTLVNEIEGLRSPIARIETAVSNILPASLVASVMAIAVLVGGLAGWLLRP